MHFVTNDNHESIRLDKSSHFSSQQKQEAATTDTDQLSSMPLSQLAMDDSGPPAVHYGMHVPTAISTPTRTEVHMHSLQQEDSYQQIIPGIHQGSLYPTLSSLSSESITSPEEAQTLHDKVSKGLEKYLQDSKQCRALEVNYFDDNATGQNEEPNLEDVERTIQLSKYNQIPSTQTFTVDTACDIMLHFVLFKIITGQGHQALITDDRKHNGILVSSHFILYHFKR